MPGANSPLVPVNLSQLGRVHFAGEIAEEVLTHLRSGDCKAKGEKERKKERKRGRERERICEWEMQTLMQEGNNNVDNGTLSVHHVR